MTNKENEAEETDSNLVLIIGLLMAGFLVGMGVAAVIEGAQGWRAFLLSGLSAVAGLLVGASFVLGLPRFKAWKIKMEILVSELNIKKQAKAKELLEMEAMQFRQSQEPTDRQVAFANRLGIQNPGLYDRDDLSEQIDIALEAKRSKQR